MCISPIQLKKKKSDGSFSVFTVPCGKCDECRSKAQSAFALECVLEARAASSMYFVTLTYDNDHVPIMGRRVFFDSVCSQPQEMWFEDLSSKKRALCVKMSSLNMDGSKKLHSLTYVEDCGYCSDTAWNEVYYTPSLRREDVRLWIKRCRVDYERKFGEKLNLRYVFFGEYGDLTLRPHYHGLLLNLSSSQAQYFQAEWKKSFGFCDFRFIPVLNSDGSSARVKVGKYISKYIRKNHYYSAIEQMLVEAPRKFSSLGFGTKCLSSSEVESLKNFIYAKI